MLKNRRFFRGLIVYIDRMNNKKKKSSESKNDTKKMWNSPKSTLRLCCLKFWKFTIKIRRELITTSN